jgi:hypothetical protein
MIDQIEDPVRDALRLATLAIPDEAGARLRAVEYHPKSARWATPAGLGAGAGAAATAATVVSVVVLGGSQPAFAGWTPTPTPTAASGSQVATAEAACEARLAAQPGPSGPTPPSTTAGQALTPVLTDVRGPYTVAIFANGSSSATCFTGPSFTVTSSRSSDGAQMSAHGSISSAGPAGGGSNASTGKASGTAFSMGPSLANGTTAADELQVSGAHFTLPSGSAYTLVEGQAGSDVTGATLVLDNGQKVEATTAGGWFEAWWPGSSTAVTAEVTTSQGTVTEQLPPWKQAPPLGAGANGSSSPSGA